MYNELSIKRTPFVPKESVRFIEVPALKGLLLKFIF